MSNHQGTLCSGCAEERRAGLVALQGSGGSGGILLGPGEVHEQLPQLRHLAVGARRTPALPVLDKVPQPHRVKELQGRESSEHSPAWAGISSGKTSQKNTKAGLSSG